MAREVQLLLRQDYEDVQFIGAFTSETLAQRYLSRLPKRTRDELSVESVMLNPKPPAPTMIKKFKPGQAVWWLRTLGGGGGSGRRPNEKVRVPAVVLKVSTRRVQIEQDGGTHRPWVRVENLEAR